jgi:hypothetical protein
MAEIHRRAGFFEVYRRYGSLRQWVIGNSWVCRDGFIKIRQLWMRPVLSDKVSGYLFGKFYESRKSNFQIKKMAILY